MSALIAIVGRPNVGKSALFNRIARRRIAIVHDEPGVTRDRVSVEAEWHGRAFTLVDTGGIGLMRGEKAHDIITQATVEQVQIAVDAANVIVFVVNVQEGVVPLDEEVARRLRRSGKTVLIAANKADNHRAELGADEFAALAFDRIFPVSAIHGYGIDSLMDAALALLPPESTQPRQLSDGPTGEKQPLKLAIVGRPNVGKSSIINTLTRSDRVVVSPIPGTTRDAIDVPFAVETEGVREQYVLIDTAGVRKETRIANSIEFYSVKRTEDSIDRSDIVVFVLDAESGILRQDKKIADKIVEARKACIIVINKWDLVKDSVATAREEELRRRKKPVRGAKEPMTTLSEFGGWVQEQMFFLDYAPVIFTSATTGFHLDRLLEAVRYVAAQLTQKIPTAILNRTLNDAVERRQPVSAMGHRLKFFYATQVRQAPPTFLLFVNRDELFSDQYNKNLTDTLRRAFGYEGCPIILIPRARPKTIEPKRRVRHGAPPRHTEGKPAGRRGSTRRRRAKS